MNCKMKSAAMGLFMGLGTVRQMLKRHRRCSSACRCWSLGERERERVHYTVAVDSRWEDVFANPWYHVVPEGWFSIEPDNVYNDNIPQTTRRYLHLPL